MTATLGLNFEGAGRWTEQIPSEPIRRFVARKLEELEKLQGAQLDADG